MLTWINMNCSSKSISTPQPQQQKKRYKQAKLRRTLATHRVTGKIASWGELPTFIPEFESVVPVGQGQPLWLKRLSNSSDTGGVPQPEVDPWVIEEQTDGVRKLKKKEHHFKHCKLDQADIEKNLQGAFRLFTFRFKHDAASLAGRTSVLWCSASPTKLCRLPTQGATARYASPWANKKRKGGLSISRLDEAKDCKREETTSSNII